MQLEHQKDFDVVVLGGGINGACLFDALACCGYRVLLLDRGDFACGTSQASGMLIWGGLLYLRNLDLRSVSVLSRARDRMVRQMPEWVTPQFLRYVRAQRGRPMWTVLGGLWLYWLMGLGCRRAPRSGKSFPELALIKPQAVENSFLYEEAILSQSDSRFVLRWITAHLAPQHIAANYCRARGQYNRVDRCWHLDVEDQLTGRNYPIRATCIANCAGVWTDQVNQEFGIATDCRHAFSKGVYLGFRRPEELTSHLIFDMGEHDDVITCVPWGQVCLWGPTETAVDDIAEGYRITGQDVAWLLEQYNHRFRQTRGIDEIVSLRCGIRPLVVDRDFRSDCYPLDLSRRQKIVRDVDRPWISCYGGKITDCEHMAARAVAMIRKMSPAPDGAVPKPALTEPVQWEQFPGVPDPVHSLAWCMRHESCCTLEDYLRRRTNISQWVCREGLGKHDENEAHLGRLAQQLAGGDAAGGQKLLAQYRAKVQERFDQALTSAGGR